MSHVNEPWKVVNRGDEECSDIDAKGPEGWGGDVTLATNIGNANARRIVACVNALKNVSTEWLEAQNGIVCLGSPIKDRFLELEKQRNELLAALARTRNMIRSNPDAAENCANDAITRVKGESS